MGSPAHAGIDRGGLGVGARNDGFPRPQGPHRGVFPALLVLHPNPENNASGGS